MKRLASLWIQGNLSSRYLIIINFATLIIEIYIRGSKIQIFTQINKILKIKEVWTFKYRL